MRRTLPALLIVLLLLSRGEARDPHPLAVLHEHCLRCHTEEKRKGGLLLTTREALLAGGDSGAAIVLGNCSDSYLAQLLHAGGDPHMPPKSQLAPEEITAIEEWIDSGAPWDEKLWAELAARPPRRDVALDSLPETYHPVHALALSPGGKTLAAARGAAIQLIDLSDPATPAPGESLAAHKDAVQSLAWSPGGKWLASGGFRVVHLWDPANPGAPVATIDDDLDGRITAIAFAGDASLVFADSTPGAPARLHVLPLAGGRPGPAKRKTVETAHDDSVFALTTSPDGKLIATASADKLVRIWDAKTLSPKSTLEGHTGYGLACAFSPQSDRIATGGDDEFIKVWRLETGKEISTFAPRVKAGPVTALAWNIDPDKAAKKKEEKDEKKAKAINTDRIVATYESGGPRLWTDLVEHEGEQRSAGAKEKDLDDPEEPVAALALDPDTGFFFTGSATGNVRAHDAAGKLITTINGTPTE